jgi:hypothetical protein
MTYNTDQSVANYGKEEVGTVEFPLMDPLHEFMIAVSGYQAGVH